MGVSEIVLKGMDWSELDWDRSSGRFSGSMKDGEFLDQMTYQLSKEYP